MPSSACCLQYAAFLLPLTLKDGFFAHEPYEQRLILAGACGSDVPVARQRGGGEHDKKYAYEIAVLSCRFWTEQLLPTTLSGSDVPVARQRGG